MRNLAGLGIACAIGCLIGSKAGAAPADGATPPPDVNTKLAAIEKSIDRSRDALHIPGAALVIVKDDKVIYAHGFGLRDVANKLPVTPQTQFAIGSSTKAFTAMTVMMSVDEGKLKLSDSPKRYLPYFKLRDPEADSKITISDLLCHRSGLDRTDLAWYTGKLTSEETIRLVGTIKPTAKFGEKFQYQNVMFLAAGQCVGAVQHAPWRTVVAQRIFKPLHMTHTNTSIDAMVRQPDHSLGYTYDADKKQIVLLPYRSLPAIAPAGAINSSAVEMAQWLRLMLGGGVIDGTRLVSEAGFAELTKKRIKVAGVVDYGYGWFLRDWNGHKVAEHGGNIDGFNAQVSLMPDQRLGFVLLTNVSASPLGTLAMETIWSGIVGTPSPEADTSATVTPVAPELEAGTYHLDEANMDIIVEAKGGKLVYHANAQPERTLDHVAGRRYKVNIPGLEGVFATFRAPKEDPKSTELLLEQPGSKFVCKRVVPSEDASYVGPQKELLGDYRNEKIPVPFQVAVRGGKVALIVPGQPAYPLNPKHAADEFSLGGLPDAFAFIVHRDSARKVTGALLKQPAAQGDLELTHAAGEPFVSPLPVDELMARVIAAQGGEANLRRHKTLTLRVEQVAESQGLLIKTTVYDEAPNRESTRQSMYAGRKRIGEERTYFDGKEGGTESSFLPPSRFSGDTLDDLAISSDMFPELDWKSKFKTVTVTAKEKVGDEEAYVVELKPAKGHPVTDYVSTKTFRIIRRKSRPNNAVEIFSDFRMVEGVILPFTRVGPVEGMGELVTTVKSAKWDARIPESTFRPTPHEETDAQ